MHSLADICFTTARGNVTDDTTHRQTWDLLRRLVGGPDVLYVADCNLATRRILDIFDNIQRHTLTGGVESQTFVTQLTPLQRQIASWFDIPARPYGR